MFLAFSVDGIEFDENSCNEIPETPGNHMVEVRCNGGT